MPVPARYLEEAERVVAGIAKLLPANTVLTASGFVASGDRCCELSIQRIATALAFIDHGPVTRQRSVGRKSQSSYWLKHRAENWGRALEFEPYIANGDMIAAALWRNIPMRRAGWARNNPNCQLALKAVYTHDGSEFGTVTRNL
jgi:hypothetical protein